MYLRARVTGAIGVIVLIVTGFIGPTPLAVASDVVGHVYVNDNTADTNTIGAFDQHADGTLTPMTGSPFAAGGTGTGTVLGSQGAARPRHVIPARADWATASGFQPTQQCPFDPLPGSDPQA
jgi:hypothetical protein